MRVFVKRIFIRFLYREVLEYRFVTEEVIFGAVYFYFRFGLFY